MLFCTFSRYVVSSGESYWHVWPRQNYSGKPRERWSPTSTRGAFYFLRASSWEVLLFSVTPEQAGAASTHWGTPLSFQFREPPRSLPVINAPQVGKFAKKMYAFMNVGTSMTAGKRKTSQCCERLVSSAVRAQFTGFCHFFESESIHMIILNCHSPVQGQLLLPFLLFIKSWQLSHNFTLRLMENLSVEFMVFLGWLLNWERSPAQSPKCGKPFSQLFNTLWPWSVDECVCIWFASPIWRNQWKPGDVWA